MRGTLGRGGQGDLEGSTRTYSREASESPPSLRSPFPAMQCTGPEKNPPPSPPAPLCSREPGTTRRRRSVPPAAIAAAARRPPKPPNPGTSCPSCPGPARPREPFPYLQAGAPVGAAATATRGSGSAVRGGRRSRTRSCRRGPGGAASPLQRLRVDPGRPGRGSPPRPPGLAVGAREVLASRQALSFRPEVPRRSKRSASAAQLRPAPSAAQADRRVPPVPVPVPRGRAHGVCHPPHGAAAPGPLAPPRLHLGRPRLQACQSSGQSARPGRLPRSSLAELAAGPAPFSPGPGSPRRPAARCRGNQGPGPGSEHSWAALRLAARLWDKAGSAADALAWPLAWVGGLGGGHAGNSTDRSRAPACSFRHHFGASGSDGRPPRRLRETARHRFGALQPLQNGVGLAT